jgi:hypothetical protein
MNEINKEIAYFDDAIAETDKDIENCSDDIRDELIVQSRYFILALKIPRAWSAVGKKSTRCTVCSVTRESRWMTRIRSQFRQPDAPLRLTRRFMRDIDAIPLEVPNEP